MSVRIKLEPVIDVDPGAFINALKAESAGIKSPFLETSETFLQNVEQNYLKSWEDWIGKLDTNLTKTVNWEEL